MRRSDREITGFDGKLEILRRCEVLHLGLSDGGRPYVVPLSFGVRAENGSAVVYFHCAASGRKLDLLRADPRVCFEADRLLGIAGADEACGWTAKYESVMGEGRAVTVEDPAEKAEGLLCILRHYGYEGGPEFAPAVFARTAVVRIDVESLSAKSNEKNQ